MLATKKKRVPKRGSKKDEPTHLVKRSNKRQKMKHDDDDDDEGNGGASGGGGVVVEQMSMELTAGAVSELEVSMLWSDLFPVLQVAHCVGVMRFCLQFTSTEVYFQSMDPAHVSLLEAHIPLCAFSRVAHCPPSGYEVDLSIQALYKAAQRPVRSNATSSKAVITLQVVRIDLQGLAATWSAYLYHGDTERFEACHEIPVYDTAYENITVPDNITSYISISTLLWKNALQAYQADTEVEIESDATRCLTFRKANSPIVQRIPAYTKEKPAENMAENAVSKNRMKMALLKPLANVMAKITDCVHLSMSPDRPLHSSFTTWTSDRIRKQANLTLQPLIKCSDLVCSIILPYLAPPNLAITFHHYIAPLDPSNPI
jgi:hypothetical protein